jgi:hypothetical protein
VFGIGPARQIALDRQGRVAWIAQDTLTPGRTYEVWRVAGDKPRRLARGADINPRVLRLIGPRAEWRQGGRTRRG